MFERFKFCAIAIAVSSLTMGGCSKSDTSEKKAENAPSMQNALSPEGAKKNDKNAPSMQNALSPEGMAAAANAALPKADSNVPLDQYVKVSSGLQLMFIYSALSNMPVNYEEIAERYSDEYRRASDGFKKQDILNALKPSIDAEIAKAKQQRYYYLTQDNYGVLRYNFDAKGFPVQGIGEDYISSFGNDSYVYSNGDSYKMLKVTDEQKARQIEAVISKNAGYTLNTYVYAHDVINRVVKFQIVKVRLLDNKGNELFSQ